MLRLISWTGAVVVALLGIAANISAAETSAAAPRKPNIVFIFADDWGWGDLSCHGHAYLKTPHLDRLASEGIDFHNFNVLNPVCSPSRTAALTGHFPARYCVHEHFAGPALNRARDMPDWLDPKAPLLPRILKAAGYRTGHFGKWHLTSAMTPGAPQPAAYGFDEAAIFNGPQGPQADYHATGNNAVAFIKAHKHRPFYVNVWLHESHTPHVPTKESMAAWSKLGEREQVYAAVITDGDNTVGKVLDALKESGLERDTIVLFSADNGPEWTGQANQRKQDQGLGTYYSVGSTGGLRGRKRSLFEGGVRVPMIVRWPGHSPAGSVDKSSVIAAVDLLPTLCAAAGVDLPPGYKPDGEDMLSALHGKPIRRTKPIYWEWRGTNKEPNWWPRLAVRDGDWKLLMTYDKKRAELYHVTDDRAEARDVAAAHPDIVARLSALTTQWKASLPKEPPAGCSLHGPDRKGPKKPAPRK